MAAGNPSQPAPRAADRPIFLHGLNEVSTACGLKSAMTANQRAQRPLIATDRCDEELARQVPDMACQFLHVPPASRVRAACRDRRSIRPANSVSESVKSCKAGGSDARAMHTKSIAGNSC